MFNINELLVNIISDETTETVNNYRRIIKANDIVKKNKDFFLYIIENINNEDLLSISLNSEYAEKNSLYSNRLDVLDNFISDLYEDIDTNTTGDIYIMEIEINKKNTKIFNIYDINCFLDNFKNLTIYEQLEFFNNKISREFKGIYCTSFNNVQTESLYFTNNKKHKYSNNIIKRNSILEKMQLNTFVKSNLDLIPNDFKLSASTNVYEFDNLINRLCLVTSLMYISNISFFEENFQTKIIGYKQLILSIENSDYSIDENLSRLFYDIYDWCYNNSNISDKLGLARNLISLGIGENFKILNENLMKSIISSYEIYLKEHIRDYFDIKAKLNESIFELNFKIADISNDFRKRFFSNLIAFLSFYLATFIGNILIGRGSSGLFTEDIFKVTFLMVLISFIYYLYTSKSVKRDIERYKKNYKRLKESYKDVLDISDLNNIFNHDKYYEEDLKEINKDIKSSKCLWIIIISVIGIGSAIFTFKL